jgi:hypothetical protein
VKKTKKNERARITSGSMPCRECPFRREAPKGWLGPWTVEEVHSTVQGEGGLACHLDVGRNGEGKPIEFYRPCVGSLLHANKTCKAYRNPRLAELQKLLKGSKHQESVLGFEFKEYHQSGVLG